MNSEPSIAVGLVEHASSVTLQLLNPFTLGDNHTLAPGRYTFTFSNGAFSCTGAQQFFMPTIALNGCTPGARFKIEITIGISFHWQQKREYTFAGNVRLVADANNRITVINDVPLESYILSVSCSEMSATSPEEFLKAHSIISRSWLLAQLHAKDAPAADAATTTTEGEIIRWYDRQSHTSFDVCADDHCQRYQGVDTITSGNVARAVAATRGVVLMHNRVPCDARFSKCCGGVTEDFRLAWGNTCHPYLVPLADTPGKELPSPPLASEDAARAFIEGSPAAYCNCSDPAILGAVLNTYDQTTNDFYRWKVTLTHQEVAALLAKKLSLDLGRITALEPVRRGLSGRLEKLRICGNKGSMVIGKELEIRRALSETHLYSSAFIVDTVGPKELPDAFVLTGAGWGHGVGLCQIGAAVMAFKGIGYEDILSHYYPESILEKLYD